MKKQLATRKLETVQPKRALANSQLDKVAGGRTVLEISGITGDSKTIVGG